MGLFRAVMCLGLVCSVAACGDSNNANNGDAGNDASTDTWIPPVDDAGNLLPFPINEVGQILCGDVPCACNDGEDNDSDGLVDGLDPECVGPQDNDEATFATGIPGDNKDPIWQDCFFDGNSGAGDDKCRYHTDCLTGENGYDEDHASCQLVEACVDFCAPLTPNGCDCFGCCTVTKSNGSTVDVFLGSSDECNIASIADPEICTLCEKSDVCGNTCGTCELCLGKTVEDLPPECNESPTCEDGTGCTASSQCPSGEYCHQGCCKLFVF